MHLSPLTVLTLITESCVEEKESSPEVGSTQSLELFGKTVVVTETHRPSSTNEVVDQCEGNLYFVPTELDALLLRNLVEQLCTTCFIPIKESGSGMQNKGSSRGSNTSDTGSSGLKEKEKKHDVIEKREISVYKTSK
ncbi:hypothetical protein Tco_0026472 [Tanacetum coccineum]